MKKTAIIFILVISFLVLGNVKATEDYSSVTLTVLESIAENELALGQVRTVNINGLEDDLSKLDLVASCPNITDIHIQKATINDMTFINYIESSNDVTLEINMCYLDLLGIDNSYITELGISASNIENLTAIESLENLKSIRLQAIYGYSQIDYSNFANLETLIFQALPIDNYETFVTQIPNVKMLSLENCNAKNGDVVYIKQLSNVTSLNIRGTLIDDVSFLSDMPNLKFITLPLGLIDVSVLYELPNLEAVYWDGYTELAITDEIVTYLDNNEIFHPTYQEDIESRLNDMITEMNITEELTKEEILKKVVIYVADYAGHDYVYDDTWVPTTMDQLVYKQEGVCANMSMLEYTLLKMLNIESYYTIGINEIYMDEVSGEYYLPELRYERAGHVWLMVPIYGEWYGIDPVQIDNGMNNNYVIGLRYNFLKNPFEDDEYDFNYAQINNLDFNYYFAKRHILTFDVSKEIVSLPDEIDPIAGTATFKTADGEAYTPGTWTNQDVEITVINGSDAETGHKSTTCDYSTVTEDGITTVTITTKDKADNVATRTYTVKIDRTAPIEGTATFKTSDGKAYTPGTWTNKDVNITVIDGMDGQSGCKSTISNYSKVTASGITTVTITTTDNVGNVSAVNYQIKIDKVAPTAGKATFKTSDGKTYTPGKWTNKDVYVKVINGSDVGSGHKTTKSNYSKVTKNGTTKVIITTTDNAGNTSTRSYTVKVGKLIAGTATFKTSDGKKYIPGTWTNKTVYVKVKNGSDLMYGHRSTRSNYFKVTWNGITKVKITTTNKKGQKATRTYIVKIKNKR